MADALIPRLPLKEEVVIALIEEVAVAVFLVPALTLTVVVHKEVEVHVVVVEAVKCHLSTLLYLSIRTPPLKTSRSTYRNTNSVTLV
jgi:hypothetical protein